ncbi:hypothetical protein M0811_04228 [Anaeramoeba ignava]|uniref:Uncharacterized protein n=1 Tax=Anaeramoeba ignava TaxID=1746090 RepID=A0A9Q0LUK6_ANAIG|nr:hypothetical protein M0811_04228 [Anaeramoeba ignava]|eukprot:Anaeramoba_ignava/a484215_8.p1 GENE.a484215_8~~a484215_8.p1  ORF type:complete len:103 (-),score=38.72 a484215_8:91-399(-)
MKTILILILLLLSLISFEESVWVTTDKNKLTECVEEKGFWCGANFDGFWAFACGEIGNSTCSEIKTAYQKENICDSFSCPAGIANLKIPCFLFLILLFSVFI